MQYSEHALANTAEAKMMTTIENKRLNPSSSEFDIADNTKEISIPTPAKQPPTATDDSTPRNTVKWLRNLLHCMGHFRMNFAATQTDGRAGPDVCWGASDGALMR